jgi:adenylate cyclase
MSPDVRPRAYDRVPRANLHITIATIFSVLIALIVGAITWYQHRESSSSALAMAERLMNETSATVVANIESLIGPAAALADLAASIPHIESKPEGLHHSVAVFLREALSANPQLYSVYMAYPDGDFYQIISIGIGYDDAVRLQFGAPPAARFALRVIKRTEDGDRREIWGFLDLMGDVVVTRPEAEAIYDPRARPWYQKAIAVERRIDSGIYVFQSLRIAGITFARRFSGNRPGVFGVDVPLGALSRLLAEQHFSEHGRSLILDDNHRVIASQETQRLLVDDENQPGEQRSARLSELGESALASLVGRSELNTRLDSRQLISVDGVDYIGTVRPLETTFAAGGAVAMVAPVSDFVGPMDATRQNSVVMAVIAIALSVLLIFPIAGHISSSIEAIAAEAEKIEKFNLDEPITVMSRIAEIDRLAHAMNAMKETLSTFGRYVPKELVRRVLASGLTPKIGGARQDVTIMFTDITNFSQLAAVTAPEELMARTSLYFDELSTGISAHGGVIDKYIGDSVMALWNAPQDDTEHVAHACRAALACRERLEAFNHRLAQQSIAPIGTRFGLHTGEAIVGNVGSVERINFTAIGSVVNLAARIEGLNKIYGTTILVSGAIEERISHRFVFRYIDRVLPAGAKIPIEIHELLGEAQSGEKVSLFRDAWNAAMALWLERRWTDAERAFAKIAETCDDPAARLFESRCHEFSKVPPPADWDGVNVYTNK